MGYAKIKRACDIIVSAAALLALWPLFILIAIAICFETAGAPLFFSRRIGQHGAVFTLFKFRSMVQDTAQIGHWQTSMNDPRITRVGRFLRHTSLDELPQLWNVLIGDMSLVGPRPNAAEQESQYTQADWQTRHRLRPGITGLAQVSGRSLQTFAERLRCDIDYAKNVNWKMDVQILWRTLAMVFTKAGSN